MAGSQDIRWEAEEMKFDDLQPFGSETTCPKCDGKTWTKLLRHVTDDDAEGSITFECLVLNCAACGYFITTRTKEQEVNGRKR